MKRFFPLIGSLLAIILCAGLASFISSTIVRSIFDEQGALAVFGTLILAMFLAFAFFALGVTMLRIFKNRKTDR